VATRTSQRAREGAAHSHLPPSVLTPVAPIRRLLLIAAEGPLKGMLTDLFAKNGIAVDFASDGIDAVKGLWAERYDAIVAEPERARVGGHRLGDVVAEIAPGTPVVVLKPTTRATTAPVDAAAGPANGLAQPRDVQGMVSDVLVAVGIAAQRRLSRAR